MFKRVHLGIPYVPTEEDINGCRALQEYVKNCPSSTPNNELFRSLAKRYSTTPYEMNRHWRCVEMGVYHDTDS